jgi:hypothetical protein
MSDQQPDLFTYHGNHGERLSPETMFRHVPPLALMDNDERGLAPHWLFAILDGASRSRGEFYGNPQK